LDNDLIHRNSADYWSPLAGYAHPGTPGKRSSIAVGVSNRHKGGTQWRTRPERPVVPNGVPRRHSNQARDTALYANGGAHAGKQWHDRRRWYAVKCDSSSCYSVLGAAPGEDAGAIRRMKRRHRYSGIVDSVYYTLELFKLCGCERLVWLVRGREMREDAGKAKIWIALDPGCEVDCLGRGRTVATQTRINLEMN
jgi:hypothetical protein